MNKSNLTFKETLKEFDETGLPLIKVLVADEARCNRWRLDRFSDEDFEAICGFVYDEILGSGVNELSFIRATFDCLYEEKLALEDIVENADKAAEIVYRQIEDAQY